MSMTDELRDGLTKRGVEWEDMSARFPTGMLWCTSWTNQDGEPCTAIEGADDIPDGKLSVQALLTPAQAIAATLGSGTCHLKPWEMERDTGFYDSMECDCGYVADVADWAEWRYCPNCGRQNVGADE